MPFLFDSFDQYTAGDLAQGPWTYFSFIGPGTATVETSLVLEGLQSLQFNFVGSNSNFNYARLVSAPTGYEVSAVFTLNLPTVPGLQRIFVGFTGLKGGNSPTSRIWSGVLNLISSGGVWTAQTDAIIGSTLTAGPNATFPFQNVLCKLQARITPTSIQTIFTNLATNQFTSVTRTTLSMGAIDRIEITAINEGPNTSSVGINMDYLNAKIINTPTQPLNVLATGQAGPQVSLSWNTPSTTGTSAVTAYNIYRSTSPGTETFYASVGNVLTYTDLGVVFGTRYFYRVAAINGSGEGDMSYSSSAMPINTPPTVPGPPILSNIVPGLLQLTLNWIPPTNTGGSPITGYKIYRSGTSGSETLLAIVGNVLIFTDTGLVPGTTYFYKIKATNSVGDSILSNEQSGIPFAFPPAAPQNVFAIPLKNYNILTWDHVTQLTNGSPISGIDSYQVFAGNLVNEFDQTLLETITSQDVLQRPDNIFIDLNPNPTRVYRVVALASFGSTVLKSLVSDKVVAIKASSQIDTKTTLLDSKIFFLGTGILGASLLI